MSAMAELITQKITAALAPEHLALENESHLHRRPGADSHWNLLVVSQTFEGKARVARHRAVYAALAVELQEAVHALTLRTLTPDEWHQGEGAATSPKCGHG